MRVHHGGQDVNLPLTVTDLRRDWLEHLRIDWKQVCQISASAMKRLLDHKKKLFEPGLCTLQGFRAKIDVVPAATPKFCKPRQVPYAVSGLSGRSWPLTEQRQVHVHD